MFLGMELVNYDYEFENKKHLIFRNPPSHIERINRIDDNKEVMLNINNNKSFIKVPNQVRTFYFEQGSDKLSEEDLKKIKALNLNKFNSIEINAFASKEGTEEFNMELSSRRAIAFSREIESFEGEIESKAHGTKNCHFKEAEKCRKIDVTLNR